MIARQGQTGGLLRCLTGGLLVMSLAIGTAGCGDSPAAPVLDLLHARALWEDVGPESYRYAIRRSCFCDAASLRTVRVTVSDGEAVEWTYVDDASPVPEALRQHFSSVSGLFDILEEAYDQGADAVEVIYDDQTGAPLSFSIDYWVEAVDEELAYTVVEPVVPTG